MQVSIDIQSKVAVEIKEVADDKGNIISEKIEVILLL
jgi:hypothetical protein